MALGRGAISSGPLAGSNNQPALTGTLSGSTVTSPGSTTVNLSSPVQTDWIQFPLSWTAPNRKAGGGSTIGLPTVLGSDGSGTFSGQATSVTWTDGTPTASSAGSVDIILAPNVGSPAVGDGIQIALPADTNSRTAVIIWSAYNGTAKLVATLSDGSAAPVTHQRAATASGAADDYQTTLTYSAGSAGQTLNIAMTLTAAAPSSGANVALQAAMYQTAGNNATVNAQLGNATASIAATETISGTVNAQLGNATASITAAEKISGTVSSALGNATASISGNVANPGAPVNATVNAQLGNATAAITATEKMTATVNAQLGNATASIAAAESITGTINRTLGNAVAHVTMVEAIRRPQATILGQT